MKGWPAMDLGTLKARAQGPRLAEGLGAAPVGRQGAPSVQAQEPRVEPGSSLVQRMRPPEAGSLARAALLVFGTLCCLYLLSSGGQGYSVDGTFTYELAHGWASGRTPPWRLSAEQRDVLRRWGPVVPALSVPFTWLGLHLGELAPRRDSVVVDGQVLLLYDWPPIGAPDAGAEPVPRRLTVPLPAPVPATRLRLVSFLSFATALPDDTPVAQLTLERAGMPGQIAGTATLYAGRDTAEWAYDVPGTERPRHRRAPLAGHWPGNPAANLYASDVALAPAAGAGQGMPGSAAADTLVVEYLAPAGRLHLRAVALSGPQGTVVAEGPPSWSAAQQASLFSRFGFSFTNAPLMALAAALLVPLAVLLGYSLRAGVLLALGTGVGTLAWPYAKYDFSETAAAAFATGATVLVLLACRPQASAPRALLLALAGGLSAALAAGAKYSAAWFIPLLAAELVLLQHHGGRGLARHAGGEDASRSLQGRRARSEGATVARLVAFLAPAALAMLLVPLATHAPPTIWTGWRAGLARGWLDFPLWDGLYGLLLSPGKSLFLYAPPLVLAPAGMVAFARRHRGAAFLFLAVPAVYLAVYGSKGVWSGGGWGPRYLVPTVPFAACLALPLIERALRPGGRWLKAGALTLLVIGAGVQLLGVLKHPNLYPIMFRDHLLPALPDGGAALGGLPSLVYWRHFGGPESGRQLVRPPDDPSGDDPPRGLGYLYAETGPLRLAITPAETRATALTLYVCDWDHQGRRQRLRLADAAGEREYVQDYDFSGCEYLTWTVAMQAGEPVEVEVQRLGGDVPVISALFFDPPAGPRAPVPQRDVGRGGQWPGYAGADGYVLLAWRRGGQDLARLPPYVAGLTGGERVWLDTHEQDLADTALLYAPAFSPLLAHAWLLGADAIADLLPGNTALLQRALASPPWHYLGPAPLRTLNAPHPEYGLGLDLWPILLRTHFQSHTTFMAIAWGLWGALAAGALACAWRLWHVLRVAHG